MQPRDFIMSSNRPYLIRAFYDWIVDNSCTPYMVVDATMDDVQVPADYARDGRIVLNISANATRGLLLGDDYVSFSTRFGGNALQICFPVDAVLGIYAEENGQGMAFSHDVVNQGDTKGVADRQPVASSREKPSPSKPPRRRGKPKLTVVK